MCFACEKVRRVENTTIHSYSTAVVPFKAEESKAHSAVKGADGLFPNDRDSALSNEGQKQRCRTNCSLVLGTNCLEDFSGVSPKRDRSERLCSKIYGQSEH